MTIVYIVLLLAANAFFVAAEFALVKVPAVRLEAMAASGGAAARMTLKIAAKLETYLATCQLGITMASLGLGWIGEPAVAALLEPVMLDLGMPTETVHLVAFLIGFIVFSSLHIVVGEQVPKTYAIREADTVSLWIAYPLQVSYLLTFPLTWALNLASNATLRLMGVAQVSHADILTGAEIQGLIDASSEHGAIEATHAEMMRNLFTFHDRPVERIMLPRQFIEYIDLDVERSELIEKLGQTTHSRLAVLADSWDDLRGVVLVKELLLKLVADDSPKPLQAHASIIREPQLVPETQPVADLFQSMQTNHNHLAFAVDEYGDVNGLVTMEDLLEEIVGDISDESDASNPHNFIDNTADGWVCDGFASLSDLERDIGLKLPDDNNANTVTGLFMIELNRLPVVGDSLDVGDFNFTIENMSGRRPTKVRIKINPAEEPTEAPKDASSLP